MGAVLGEHRNGVVIANDETSRGVETATDARLEYVRVLDALLTHPHDFGARPGDHVAVDLFTDHRFAEMRCFQVPHGPPSY